eukprot:SAG31_NODE_1435_length_8356_cov_148.657503_3_plen_299_part_00
MKRATRPTESSPFSMSSLLQPATTSLQQQCPEARPLKKRPHQLARRDSRLPSSAIPSCTGCYVCRSSSSTAAGAHFGSQCGGTGANPELKQRNRRHTKRKRSNVKLGKWWSSYGYRGPNYCQRCSEVFRDHIIRQFSNSAGCTRKSPCADCKLILEYFAQPDMADACRQIDLIIDCRQKRKLVKRWSKADPFQVGSAASMENCANSTGTKLISDGRKGSCQATKRSQPCTSRQASDDDSCASTLLALSSSHLQQTHSKRATSVDHDETCEVLSRPPTSPLICNAESSGDETVVDGDWC